MIIGIDASRANLKIKTGTEWYSYNLIQELKKIIPQEYKVVLYSKETLIGELAILPSNWENKVLWWPFKLWTQIRFSFEMLKFWSRPDLLFIPAHTIPIIHPKKTVLVTHDIGFDRRKELYSPKELGYHCWAMRYAIKHALHIITVSNFSKKEIIDFYNYPEAKISVVYNGFNQENNMIKKTSSSITKEPYLLYIGRLEEKKNTPRLIEAFNILKKKYSLKHKLVLIGMPGYKYNLVQQNINKYNLKNEIFELGYLDGQELSQWLKSADLFLFPSLYEGFGIPLLEAMKHEVPIVCSKIPSLVEVAEKAAKYFDPLSINDMAETIYQTLNNKDLKNRLILEGKLQVKKFSYEKCAQETWKVLCNLIGQ